MGIVHSEIYAVNRDVRHLVGVYALVDADRRAVFHGRTDPEKLRRYHSKNLYPANLLYKLLERYHYMKLLQVLKHILGAAGGQISTVGEVEQIRDELER